MAMTETAPTIGATAPRRGRGVTARILRRAWGYSEVDGRWRRSITNVGIRPTFDDASNPSIESYIFDFDGDLYGDVLRVRFLHRIRDERKFNGIDELRAQIERDTRRASAR